MLCYAMMVELEYPISWTDDESLRIEGIFQINSFHFIRCSEFDRLQVYKGLLKYFQLQNSVVSFSSFFLYYKIVKT